MKKFLLVFMMAVSVLCLAFGAAACEETESGGNAGDSAQEQQQPGDNSGSGSQEGSQGSQSGNQGGSQESPESQIEVKVYIDNVLSETLYTSASKGYKIALPAKPEDMSTNPELNNYFDGWYADEEYSQPLTGEETYSAASAIYGQNIIPSGTYDFKYTVTDGEATITGFNGDNTDTTIVIPRYIDSFPVTTIGKEAFQDEKMICTVFLCEGLKIIGPGAFGGCTSMQKVVIPSTVTLIDGAFPFCIGLTSVTIPDSVTELGEYAFSGCSGLTSVNLIYGQ